MKATIPIPLVLGFCFISGTAVHAQQLFSDNFDADHTANWTVNTLGPGNDANFFFDYSTLGIPSAPHSIGGTTLGLRLRAHMLGSAAVFPAGVSVSPNGQSFSGDYQLRFDCWWNFNGPAPGGGSGSTQVTGAGIGTAGTLAQIAGGTIDSISVGTTGDGGTSADYRVYAPGFQSSYQDTSGVYAAGNVAGVRNSSNIYYAGLGGGTPPAGQTLLYPQQTGTADPGAPAFAWREFVITKMGDTVTWSIDGLLIATIDLTTAGTLGGGNILFDQYDINTSVSTDPNSPVLEFGLIDNVRVTVIPEPGACALAALGALAASVLRRRG